MAMLMYILTLEIGEKNVQPCGIIRILLAKLSV